MRYPNNHVAANVHRRIAQPHQHPGIRRFIQQRARAKLRVPPQLPGTPPVAPDQPGTPPTTETSIPGQGAYLQQQGLAEQAYQNALADIAQRKQTTMRDYGFLEGGQIDPNNQYGQVQQLFRGQGQASQQTEGNLLSRGLRGGIAGQSLSMLRENQGGERLQLQHGYEGSLADLARERTAAETEHSGAMLAAQQEALQQALQGDDFTPADVGDPEAPPQAQLPAQLPVRRVARKHLTRVMRQRLRPPARKPPGGRHR